MGKSLAGEQSAPSSLNHMPLAYCAPDRMNAFSRLSRYGVTFAHLTDALGEAVLMWCLADSHAKTYQSQGGAQGLMESEAASGVRCSELLARFDPDLFLWKTALPLFPEGLGEFSQTLPDWGMTQGGALFLQPALVHHIPESAFGFALPTPVASDGTMGAVIGKNDKFYQAESGLPRKVNQNGHSSSVGLARLVQMWPTPTATDGRGSGKTGASRDRLDYAVERGQTKSKTYFKPNSQGSGKLNPAFSEWLMGWPIGWSDLKPLGLAKFQQWQQLHGICSHKNSSNF